jgi:hypothetical protein
MRAAFLSAIVKSKKKLENAPPGRAGGVQGIKTENRKGA